MTTHNLVVKSQSTRIWVIGLFMLGGGALFLLGNNWNKLFPTNTSTVYKTGLALVFLVTALALRRHATLKLYWPLAYALFVGAAANLVNWLLGNWLLPLISAEMTVAQDLAVDKLAQCIPVVATIIILTLLAGDDLGSIFLRRGRVKAWLTFGLISFAVCALLFAVIAVLQADNPGASGLTAGGVPLATIGAALPFILIFVFANAIMEELWFRGIFLNKLAPLTSAFAAITATSLIFGVAHIGATYISPVEMFVFPLIVFGVGVLNAFVMLKTDSIWGSVLFHAGYDLLIIIPVILVG